MGDDHSCSVEGICIILIKMFDGMVRELKKVRYFSQLKKNLILVGDLEALGLEIAGKDGILKMLRGSMVVMKGVRCNNLYYLKGNTVTGKWKLLLVQKMIVPGMPHEARHTGEKSLQALTK